MNVILRKNQTHVKLVEYLHKACLSPKKEDIHQSHKMKKIHTWPGLTEELVNKHLPKSISTARGHMTSKRKGLQSTTRPPATNQQKLKDITNKFLQLKMKIKPETAKEIVDTIDEDYFPVSDIPNKKTHEVCYFLISPDGISTGFMDFTGRFPQKSSQGHEYIHVGYHYDSNLIHGIPVKNRKGSSLSEAWEQLNEIFGKSGEEHSTWLLDNETSKELR